MSDAMKNLFPATVNFLPGEEPTAQKLNSWSLQEKNTFTDLANAIGNVWNRDNTLQAKAADVHPLMFTNLTRAVGNMEKMNPRFIYGSTRTRFSNALTAGETENLLDFWVDLPDNYTAEDLLGAVYETGSNGETLDPAISLNLSNVKLTPQSISQAGDWTVVGRTLYTAVPTSSGFFIFDGIWNLKDIAVSFSVIPFIAQVEATEGTGMAVTKVVGGDETYYILTTPNYNLDYDGNPAHSTFRGMQIPIPSIARYNTGQQVPAGLLTLWDLGDPINPATAVRIEGATFYGRSNNYSVVVKNVDLEEDNARYVLVCAAEGIAYALDSLRDSVIDIMNGVTTVYPLHSSLRHLRANGNDIYGNPIIGFHSFAPSRVQANDHSQYLHRDGFDPTDVGAFSNAILGKLMLASVNAANGYLNLTYDSNRIQFGSQNGPEIYYDHIADAIKVDGIAIKNELYRVKASSADTSTGYLASKLKAGTNVTMQTVTAEDGSQQVQINATATGGQGEAGEAFPIGAIYLSVDQTNPATTLGYGTWVATAEGKMLLGAGGGFVAGATGGSIEKDLSHAHSTPDHHHEIAEDRRNTVGQPPGYHNSVYNTAGSDLDYAPARTGPYNWGGQAFSDDGNDNTGSSGDSTQDIMPPYLVIYIWQRTA